MTAREQVEAAPSPKEGGVMCAVDRDELARVLCEHDHSSSEICDLSLQRADALLSSGVLVAAADVRARALEDAADAIEKRDDMFGWEELRRVATFLRDRAVSEREGATE